MSSRPNDYLPAKHSWYHGPLEIDNWQIVDVIMTQHVYVYV